MQNMGIRPVRVFIGECMDLTAAHTNTQAQALYESLGWERDTVFRAYNWVPVDN